MHRLSSVRWILTAALLVLIMSLAGCTAAPGPAATPTPSASATETRTTSIVVEPKVVDLKTKTIDIYGSGFTPGTIVSLGMPGVPKSKTLPEAKDLWFDSVTVNKNGAFMTTIDLSQSLFSLVSTKVLTEKEVEGVYAIVALDAQGDITTTPLSVVAPAPAPAKPAAAPASTTPAAPPK